MKRSATQLWYLANLLVLPFSVGSHREEGGPCWDVGEHAQGLGVGLNLAGQGLPDSRVEGPMVGANLLE
eukprot:156525-Pelagomonas_calceolata.AAC.1